MNFLAPAKKIKQPRVLIVKCQRR